MTSPARRALALVLGLVALTGAGGYVGYLRSTHEVPQGGGRVVEGLVVDGSLSLLPPFAADTQNSRDLSSLLYRGLTRPAGDGWPTADLAQSWSVDSSAKVWTFHLKPGLRWSDGKPITSADALYTLTLLQGDQLSGTLAGQAWAGITASAPAPDTIVYTLPAPSAPFMSQTSLGLVPAHALASRPPESLREATDAPTSGAFVVGGLERDRLRLDRNPNADPQPLLDGIDLRLFGSQDDAVAALIAGDIDLLSGLRARDAARLRGRTNRAVLRSGSFSYLQLLMNQAQGSPLSDQHLRAAVTAAIDRADIIRADLGGYARLDASPIPPTISWASSSAAGPSQDLTGTRRQLEGAGWTLPSGARARQKNGTDLNLQLATLDADPYPAIAAHIARDLTHVGVNATVTAYPQSRLLTEVLAGHRFDLALTPYDNGPDPDIYIFWHSPSPGVPSYNFSGMAKDVFLDKDLEDGRFQSDLKARTTAYEDAQRILRLNQPAVFLYCPDVIIGINQRLRGLTLPAAMEPSGRYSGVAAWYVQTRRVKR